MKVGPPHQQDGYRQTACGSCNTLQGYSPECRLLVEWFLEEEGTGLVEAGKLPPGEGQGCSLMVEAAPASGLLVEVAVFWWWEL